MYLGVFLIAAATTAAMGLPDQGVLNSVVDSLIMEAQAALRKNEWDSYFLPEINEDLVIVQNGMPQLGNFKANGGTLSDLATLKRSSDVIIVGKGNSTELQVPLDFGKLNAKYNQYFFKFGWTTYVGGFTTVFNKTSASAIITLSGSQQPCNVTITRASMDTFGKTSSNIQKPPALVEKLSKLEESVAVTFFRSIPVLEDFLKKGLKVAAEKVDLCVLLQQ